MIFAIPLGMTYGLMSWQTMAGLYRKLIPCFVADMSSLLPRIHDDWSGLALAEREGIGIQVRGSIDESERQFSEAERRIAALLANEGKTVKAKAEVTGHRVGDAEVDGVLTEFKSLSPGATSATVRNVINNSIRRGGQARAIVLDARGAGLMQAEATRGLARARKITRGRINSARIIGNRFDVTSADFQ